MPGVTGLLDLPLELLQQQIRLLELVEHLLGLGHLVAVVDAVDVEARGTLQAGTRVRVVVAARGVEPQRGGPAGG